MSLIGRLFATPKSIEKTLDAAISAGDKLVFTKEERAEMNLKIQDWYLEYLKATQPMNLARRVITIVITALWSLYLLIGSAFFLSNKFESSDYVFKIMDDNLNSPFMIIIGFYFAAHVAGKLGK